MILGAQQTNSPNNYPRVIIFWLLMLGALAVVNADNQPSDTASQQSVLAPLANKSLLVDIAYTAYTKSRLIAVGERGHVLLSDSAGESWTQAPVPTQSLLTAINVATSNLAVVVGHDATILLSEDNGTHWQRVHYQPELEQPLFDVWLSDSGNGLAVGAYGLYLKTVDGGRSWQQSELVLEPEPTAGNEEKSDHDLPPDFHLYAIKKIKQSLFMVGEAGTLYRSNNQGGAWKQITSPYQGTWYGITEINGGDILIYGLQGHCYVSKNNGDSWQQIITQTRSSLVNALQLADGRIILVGFSGTVLVLNRDLSVASTSNLHSRASLSSLAIANNKLIIVGSQGIEQPSQQALGQAISP